MTNPEADNGKSRDELVQRLELMEAMIAEGRQYTGRNSWIFVLWGVVDLIALSWQHYSPHFGGPWAWPICLPVGAVLTVAGKVIQLRSPGYSKNAECNRVMSVWGMMGLAMGIYVASAMLTHFDWQFSYMAAILMMMGMAHAISAAIGGSEGNSVHMPNRISVAVAKWINSPLPRKTFSPRTPASRSKASQ